MYDRNTLSCGIVHFGVGNFHRAHLQYYNNLLMEYEDQRNWGVFGSMIMPTDGTLYSALKSSDCVYNLIVCHPCGKKEVHTIKSLTGLCWGEENPSPIIEQIALPETKIITLTITEGGYVVNPDQPRPVFWYVAQGLRKRMLAGLPITILSCDNLQHNGEAAAKAFLSYFDACCPDIAAWARENVSFPNSMVDRITPATKPEETTDVYCEDYIQWVIEDNFIAGRPAWERVGVQFTKDVSPYENMKLSLLNASHSLLCYPAYLEGYKKVDSVLADSRYRKLLRDFMEEDVTPFVPVPEGIDLGDYKEKLLSRFSNPSISDQVSRLCGDGISKFVVYIVPTLAKIITAGKDTRRLAFLLASYYKYLKNGKTESGEVIDIFEPHITDNDKIIMEDDSTLGFLKLSSFAALELSNYPLFVVQYLYFVKHSVAEGLEFCSLN